MSLQPPVTAQIGQVWVDPISADRQTFATLAAAREEA